MKAQIGDRLVVTGTRLGDPRRTGVVLEVHGTGGSAPYLVRWEDNGHESLCFPGPDARIEHVAAPDQAG